MMRNSGALKPLLPEGEKGEQKQYDAVALRGIPIVQFNYFLQLDAVVFDSVQSYLSIRERNIVKLVNKNLNAKINRMSPTLEQVNSFFKIDVPKDPKLAEKFLGSSKQRLQASGAIAVSSFRFLGLIRPELDIDSIIEYSSRQIEEMYKHTTGIDPKKIKNWMPAAYKVFLNMNTKDKVKVLRAATEKAACAAAGTTAAGFVAWGFPALFIHLCCQVNTVLPIALNGTCYLSPAANLAAQISSGVSASFSCFKNVKKHGKPEGENKVVEHRRIVAQFLRQILIHKQVERSYAKFRGEQDMKMRVKTDSQQRPIK